MGRRRESGSDGGRRGGWGAARQTDERGWVEESKGGVRSLQGCGSETTPSREREEKQTPGDKRVTSVYPCIKQLFRKLTIKRPYLVP